MTPENVFETTPFLSQKLPPVSVIIGNIQQVVLNNATPSEHAIINEFFENLLQQQYGPARQILQKYRMVFKILPYSKLEEALYDFYKYLYLSNNLTVLWYSFFDTWHHQQYLSPALLIDKLLIALHTQNEQSLSVIFNEAMFSEHMKRLPLEAGNNVERIYWIFKQSLLETSQISLHSRKNLAIFLLEHVFQKNEGHPLSVGKLSSDDIIAAYKLLALSHDWNYIQNLLNQSVLCMHYLKGEEIVLSEGKKTRASLEELSKIFEYAITSNDNTTINYILTPLFEKYLQGDAVAYDGQESCRLSLSDGKNIFEAALRRRKNYIAKVLWKNRQLKRNYMGLDNNYQKEELISHFQKFINTTCSDIILSMIEPDSPFLEIMKTFSQAKLVTIGSKLASESISKRVFEAFVCQLDDIQVLNQLAAATFENNTHRMKLECIKKRIEQIKKENHIKNTQIALPEPPFFNSITAPEQESTPQAPLSNNQNPRKRKINSKEKPAEKSHPTKTLKRDVHQLPVVRTDYLAVFSNVEGELQAPNLSQSSEFVAMRWLNTPGYDPRSPVRGHIIPIQNDSFNERKQEEKQCHDHDEQWLESIHEELCQELGLDKSGACEQNDLGRFSDSSPDRTTEESKSSPEFFEQNADYLDLTTDDLSLIRAPILEGHSPMTLETNENFSHKVFDKSPKADKKRRKKSE